MVCVCVCVCMCTLHVYMHVVRVCGSGAMVPACTRWTGLVGIIAVVLLTTVNLTMISNINYPGGEAFATLHHICDHDEQRCRYNGGDVTRVHISVPPAQTGVSRYGESTTGNYLYSKVEAWGGDDMPSNFDWLLTGASHTAGASCCPCVWTNHVDAIRHVIWSDLV